MSEIDWQARRERARAYLAQRQTKLTPIPPEVRDKHAYYWQETTTYECKEQGDEVGESDERR